MSSWKGKTRGGLLGYRIFIFILRNVGLIPAYGLLYVVSGYYWLFTNKKYPVYYLHNRLGYSKTRAFFLTYRMYHNFGRVLIDKVAALSGSYTKFTYNFEGEHHLHSLKDGGMLIGAHLGNWEIAGELLKRIDTPVHIVMFDEEHRRIKKMLENVMKGKTFSMIPIKKDMSHIYRINHALKNKELIVMHGDRYVEGSKTIRARFLGEDADFPAGPFHISVKFGVPVTFVFALKENRRHYHFFATPPRKYIPGPTNNREETLQELVKDYIFELENKVRTYPLHWFNFYDFWGVDK